MTIDAQLLTNLSTGLVNARTPLFNCAIRFSWSHRSLAKKIISEAGVVRSLTCSPIRRSVSNRRRDTIRFSFYGSPGSGAAPSGQLASLSRRGIDETMSGELVQAGTDGFRWTLSSLRRLRPCGLHQILLIKPYGLFTASYHLGLCTPCVCQ